MTARARSRDPHPPPRTRRAAALGIGLACGALCVALSTGAAAQAPEAKPEAPASPWSMRLSAELGVGGRSFDVPTDGVVAQTDAGTFPAAGLGLELGHAASQHAALALLVRYQTSLGLGIVERHTDGSQHALDARSHRLELALAPSIDLDDAGSWALSASVGYAMANFRPEAHQLVTPTFTLGGPHLRLELRLALGDDAVRLRVGPEVQWIVHSGEALADRGIDSSGVGIGGEAALELPLTPHWSLHAGYRELHSFLGSSQSQSFTDVLRFATAGVSGAL